MAPEIRTPAPSPSPRINGPGIFGVRPGSPFLYKIPATGQRPLTYTVEGLPAGLSVDAANGQITGRLDKSGEYRVTFRVRNTVGEAEKLFRIVAGEQIGLTPPLGWNSWNCWAAAVDQEKVLRSAKAFVSSGLIDHGWTYINIDDTWQGARGGPHQAIQSDPQKFPNMKGLADDVHALGLKIGIYSTPWVTSYAGRVGGSSDNAEGQWTRREKYQDDWRLGKTSFEKNDAAQLAEWGFDYLKYDWNPNDVAHTRAMSEALRASGRDIFFSLSNSAPFESISELSVLCNAWRTTGDIVDVWQPPTPEWWQMSVSAIGFSQDKWVPYGKPGHYNDPDMLVVGFVGWGPQLHATHLSAAEQYSHISLWALLSAPLLIGCDLERLDPFTLNLLTNDEVLAINQDALAITARRVATMGALDVFAKELEDGSYAVGVFNRGDVEHTAPIYFSNIGPKGPVQIRDVWRQKDLGQIEKFYNVTLAPHDVMLLRVNAISPAKN